MSNTKLIRLDRLASIAPESVPTGKRDAVTRHKHDVRAATGRAIFAGAMTFLIGIVAAGLSMMSAFAWVGSSPIVASCLAVESAFMLICSGVFSIGLRRTLRDRRTFKPSAHLLLEAETEQALDDAIREVNAQAEAWNKAAKVAQRYTLSDGLAAAIHDRRRFISGRIDEFRIRLRRHRLSAAPMPQELAPPHDWGVSEPFDLARHPGS